MKIDIDILYVIMPLYGLLSYWIGLQRGKKKG